MVYCTYTRGTEPPRMFLCDDDFTEKKDKKSIAVLAEYLQMWERQVLPNDTAAIPETVRPTGQKPITTVYQQTAVSTMAI